MAEYESVRTAVESQPGSDDDRRHAKLREKWNELGAVCDAQLVVATSRHQQHGGPIRHCRCLAVVHLDTGVVHTPDLVDDAVWDTPWRSFRVDLLW